MNLALHGRKLSAAITLVTLALSALFLAQGTTSLIAGSLLPPQPVATSHGPQGKVEQPPGAEAPDTHELLKRNIFDPTVGPLWPPKPKEPDPSEVAEGAAAPTIAEQLVPGHAYPPCEGALKMIAGMHFERLPEWSFATLGVGAETPLLYRTGGHIEDKEIVEILPKAVTLSQTNGKLCSVAMFFDKTAAATAKSAAVPPPAAPAATPPSLPTASGGLSEAEMDQNIHAVSETKFNIQKSFVDKILQNQAQIMSSARIVPHEENGQVVGVKMYGIRRNSLLGKLGLQNGDLLRTINGFEMSDPTSALEAYSRLRSANSLSVSIVRRGQATNMQYEMQ